MEDINIVAKKIIADKKYRKELYKSYNKSSDDYFYDNYDGEIQPEVLRLFMKQSFHNKKMQVLLDEILRYCNQDSIDTTFFEYLLGFPKKRRNSYIITLAHLPLSFIQLYKLNSIFCTMEAFCEMFYIICKNDCFKPIDMKLLLNESKMTDSVIKYCAFSIEKELGMNNKIKVAHEYFNSNELH